MNENDEFSSILERYSSQLDRIWTELVSIANIDDMFWQVQSIINENSIINHSNTFLNLMVTTYIDPMIIRIRRIADRRHSTISLWKLLEDIKNYPLMFSRSWYLSNFNDRYVQRQANTWFDNLVGVGEDHLQRQIVITKQNNLIKALSVVNNYANTRVAHLSNTEQDNRPTFRDIREAVASIIYCL
ncbi:hypothetical protein ACFL5H_00320 [Candidatus Latescibacterota bacterium]